MYIKYDDVGCRYVENEIFGYNFLCKQETF